MAESSTSPGPSSPTRNPSSSTSDPFLYTDFKPVYTSRKRRKERPMPCIRSHVITLCETLAEGKWFTECSNLLKIAWDRSSASVIGSSTKDCPNRVRVLCLGLGSPCTSKDARIQLAFLLEGCKSLNIAEDAISVCDPIFTREDTTLLEQLSLTVLHHDTHVLTHPTILFMPHCDLELYESILSVNQNNENLSRLFLIGNSFRTYLDKSKANLQSIAPCILQTTPKLTEISLPVCTSWPTAFNNTSILFLEEGGGNDSE